MIRKLLVAASLVLALGVAAGGQQAMAARGYDAECLANFTKTCCDKVFTEYPAGTLPRNTRMQMLAACVADEKAAANRSPPTRRVPGSPANRR